MNLSPSNQSKELFSQSEKVAIAFSGAGGEEDAIESAVRTKMVEESPVDGIRAVRECALPSDLTLD